MNTKTQNYGSLIAGILLMLFGGLALASQFFGPFDFWGNLWPLIIIGVGAMLFVGMFAGGRGTSGLAIPGSIITVVGLLLMVQNLTGHWESWSYGWTIIIASVGLGIYLMGIQREDEGQRQSGIQVMKVGAVLFILFGAFFEMIFNSSQLAQIAFPIGLILLGGYLILRRGAFGSAGQEE
jgi:hypothetical protein